MRTRKRMSLLFYARMPGCLWYKLSFALGVDNPGHLFHRLGDNDRRRNPIVRFLW